MLHHRSNISHLNHVCVTRTSSPTAITLSQPSTKDRDPCLSSDLGTPAEPSGQSQSTLTLICQLILVSIEVSSSSEGYIYMPWWYTICGTITKPYAMLIWCLGIFMRRQTKGSRSPSRLVTLASMEGICCDTPPLLLRATRSVRDASSV